MEKLWKATSSQGSWFATIEGDEIALPCVHKCWTFAINQAMVYRDPFIKRDMSKLPYFVDAIKKLERVILTNDEIVDGEPVKRKSKDGYIAEYAVKDVVWDEPTGLAFRFIKTLRKLK